ncbi:hypothetical protein FNF31_06548 [Cafeteria roenbergensis]|uniref:XPG-I domain-containing protein n=2 Tax=Cafeteria roenbergensis TaxID=33653 RepID=A0A5A8CLY4_CAFRO|nr:hypothetical protein FNF31_06548 [Cafeteria roenbergensis]
MGVLNLWKLLQPCGRRVAIETLRGEVLAVDVSIWLTQFVKAMRDDEGMMLKNAHVVGTFRRICKLMFHRIRPVFVFDGGTPALKRKTVLLRRQRRQDSAQATERAAQRLLLNHIRQAALRRPKPEPAVPAFAAASGTLGGGASPAEAEEPASPSQGGGSVSGAEGQAQEAHDSDSDGALAVALEESITAAQARAAVPDGGGSASAPLSAAAAAAAAVFDEESDDDGDGDGRDTGQDNSDGGAASRQSSRGRGGGSGPSRRAMWWARVTGDDADSGAAFVPEAEAGRVDADALRALPSSLQQEYIGEIRRQQQQRARRTMLPAAGDPTAFSRVQVMSFLQGAQLNLTVDRINAEQAAAVTEGGRIAGDAGRQFLLQRADGSNVEVSGMQRRAALLGAVGAGRSREEEAAAAEAKAAADAAARQARRRRLGHGPAGGVAPGADGAAQVDEDEALASALRAAEARQALESGDLTGVLALDGEEGGDGGDGDAGGDDDDVFGFGDMGGGVGAEDASPADGQPAAPPLEPGSTHAHAAPPEDAAPPSPASSPGGSPVPALGAEVSADATAEALRAAADTATRLTSWAGAAVRRIIRRHDPSIADQIAGPKADVPAAPPASAAASAAAPDPSSAAGQPAPPGSAPTSAPAPAPDRPGALVTPAVRSARAGPAFSAAAGALAGSAGAGKAGAPLGREQTLEELEREEDALQAQAGRAQRDAEGVTETMRAEVMEVLDLWGIPYIVAPMEAEAQCAELERMGLVSGVVTDDSDAFLFGARRVYKNIFESAKYVEAYRMEDVEREVGLDRDDLVRAALLLGSDYTDGVRGVGIVNTVEILRAFPGDDGLREFRRWLDGVEGAAEEARLAKEAKKNPEVLESADPALRFRLTHQGARRRWVVGDTFPNRHVLDAYRRPNVSHVDSRFVWDAPDFDALARFAVAKLGFSEQHAAAVLLPVAQELKQRSVQRGIRGFLMGYGDGHRAGVVRSKRLREAVEGLAGKESAAELAKDEPVPADKAVPSGWSHSSVSLPAVPALPGAAPSTRRTLESSPSPKLPARGARPMSGPSKKKPRMRTAADVIKRLLWDASLPEEGFSVGYLDRFVGVLEEPFNADDAVWQDVPEHRIQWFRYRGVPIWQKDVRLDLVFGTAGGAGRTLPGVVSAIDAKRDAEEAEAAQRTELGAAARAEGGSGPEEEAEEHEAAAATAAAATAAAAAPAAVAPAAVLAAAKRPPFAAGKGRAADASSPRGGSTACSDDGSVSRLSEDDAATRHALRRAAPTASPFAPGLSRERSASDPGKVSVRPHAGVAAIAARADAALSEAGWTVQPRTEDGVLMAELLPEEASPVGSPVLPSAEAALRIGFASAESPADLASTGVVVECLQLYRLPACDA